MRALIVEDSREDLLNLRSLLGQVPEVEIVGEAHTLAAARAAATETAPDVVFLDIELGPDNGFDLLEHLPAATRVIFTTVHTGYGAEAFDVEAVDYLVKPVSEDRLLRALAKLRAPGVAPLTKVQVYRGGGERHQLALEAVAAITADRDYSKVICGSREYPDHRRFSEWSDLLSGKGFSQLDRSTSCTRGRLLALVSNSSSAIPPSNSNSAAPLPSALRSRRANHSGHSRPIAPSD